ncbi:MAG: TIGR04086 family membrane protein [Clostridia bacterium]|nr:TIGR04086 family membrane protein [Clostridia bacterium]
MSEDLFKEKKSKLGTILIGAALGVAVTLLSLLIFAAVIYFLGLDRAYSAPFATLALAFGSFTAAYSVSKRIGHKGYLTGTLVGLVSFGLVTVISLTVNKSGLTLNTLFHFIIIVLASAIGGISGVNRGKSKKFI